MSEFFLTQASKKNGLIGTGSKYLLSLSRYAHLNPVKVAGVKLKTTEEKVTLPRKYRWSSYPGYIDEDRRLEFVEYSPVSATMGGDSKKWPGLYRCYVEEGLACSDRAFPPGGIAAVLLSKYCGKT